MTATKTKTKSTANYEQLGPRYADFVLPPDVDLPPEIDEANAAVLKAALALQDAEAAAGDASALAADARDFDLRAARAAIEAGEPDVKLTAPVKAAAAEAADVRRQSAERLLSEKSRHLIRLLAADPGYVEARRADADEAARGVAEAVAALPELIGELLRARARLQPAVRIAAGDWSRSGPVVERGDTAATFQGRVEKAQARRQRNRSTALPPFEELLADLQWHLDHHTYGPWGEVIG